MSFGISGFASVEAVEIEVYTSAYLVTGAVHTPFRRVSDILNQLPSGHLMMERASIREHGRDEQGAAVGTAVVSLDEICVIVAPGVAGEPRAEMRIARQLVPATLVIPPLRLEGTLYVPIGTDPIVGLLNLAERFVTMTDVVLSSASHPWLGREIPALAVRRASAHVMALRAADEESDPSDGG